MQTITTQELKKLIDNKANYILIDVREKEELQYGMIPTAHNIPLSELGEAITLLESNPEQFKKTYNVIFTKTDRIILHCRSGSRSDRAAEFLIEKGYQAENYLGSILEWSEIDPNVRAY